MTKLAIIVTHPIQYYVPLFRLLAKICDLKVFYTWGEGGLGEKFDPDFNRKISWDIPLLDGYSFEVVKNTASDPGSHHFMGIRNPDLIGQLTNFNPDKLLVYGWSYASHLKVMRHFKNKVPIYFRGDSNLLDDQSNAKKVIRSLLLKWIYSYVDTAFYVGEANKRYYEQFGLKPSQLIYLPHTIDNNRFSQDRSTESNTLRKELGLNTDDILILFAGKFESKKDPETLLSAFLKLDNPKIHILFVGNGELESKLKTQSSGSRAQRIHFMNFQNQTEMPVIYQACDLFCLPSKGPGETWGLAINEAMAAGKAVIVSDKVGCHFDLVNSSNGFIFKAGDEGKLTSILISLTKEDLLQKGVESKQKVKHFSYQIAIDIIKKHLIEA
ncbi:glycosyltransferase family 4 protein [Pedobacter insulae]|uniref:Glycosyltransferase involved in cell wall bisynthesis n=1 Tax=Pedobacter insulae TaxID=414048 RepID=A0A1I2VW16_9SPHI|nr:glycosyltransferase family 4 protein [Pedobacter insulae]SFG93212.1 Glycosyltransferase involved in cell wall bisynthesis [Pedobacter insulae]